MAILSEARPKNQPSEKQLSALLHIMGDQLRAGAISLNDEARRVNVDLLGAKSDPVATENVDPGLSALDWIERSVQVACEAMNETCNLLAKL